MTGRKSYEPQKCMAVINHLQEEQFPPEPPDDFLGENLDFSTYTSIWKHPERLQTPEDYSLLLATLSRAIHMGNYQQTLLILKLMKKSGGQSEIIDRMFHFLLFQVLKEERQRKTDAHIILNWLDAGDRLFCGEIVSKRSYAILKLYFLCRNRKSKLECFSCGCIQKHFIELYTENNNTRLIEALKFIMSKSLGLEPTLKRLFTSLPQMSPLEYFEYYIELLGELQNCSVIEKSDKNQLSRMVQLIGVLCELKLEDVPRACSRLNALIGSKPDSTKKKSSLIENVLRGKLLPKIFDSIMMNPLVKMEIKREAAGKMMQLVTAEKYTYASQANVFFAPLQLLNRIYLEFDVWEKTWPIVKNRLDASKSTSSIVILYVLSLIYRNDASLIGHLVEHLEQQYKEATIGGKTTILILLEIMEKLGDSTPPIHVFFKENRTKNRLLMDSDLEICLEYLPDFSASELNLFLQQKTFSDDEFAILVEKIRNFHVTITSDVFWRCLLERIDENSMIFIENQMKLLVNRHDRQGLKLRIDQIFKKMKTSIDLTLFSKFPKILMDFSDAEWAFLPNSTTISLVSVLILAFCTVFEGNEPKFTQLFRQLIAKINKTTPDSIQDPLEIIEEICEKIRCGQVPGPPIDTSFLQDLYKSTPENTRKKERIVEIASILFAKLAADLQKLGDKIGSAPFSVVVTIVDLYVKKALKEGLVANFETIRKVCERAMEGYGMYRENWNWLFIRMKVFTILDFAQQQDSEFLRGLMRIVYRNETLLAKLRGMPEFVKMEKSLDA